MKHHVNRRIALAMAVVVAIVAVSGVLTPTAEALTYVAEYCHIDNYALYTAIANPVFISYASARGSAPVYITGETMIHVRAAVTLRGAISSVTSEFSQSGMIQLYWTSVTVTYTTISATHRKVYWDFWNHQLEAHLYVTIHVYSIPGDAACSWYLETT